MKNLYASQTTFTQTYHDGVVQVRPWVMILGLIAFGITVVYAVAAAFASESCIWEYKEARVELPVGTIVKADWFGNCKLIKLDTTGI